MKRLGSVSSCPAKRFDKMQSAPQMQQPQQHQQTATPTKYMYNNLPLKLNVSSPPPILQSSSTELHSQANNEELSSPLISLKHKRKSKSSRLTYRPKDWVSEDAMKVLALEEEYATRNARAPILMLRFPDPELNREIISKYSPDIESVHFQQNSAPRYCFVHLKAGADIEKTIETISKVPFGTGFVSAELKRIPPSIPTNPEDVDPCSLYIGNLPMTITIHTVKQHFPGANRIDIGHAQRMKFTRYAFIRYDTVDKAIAAYKRSVNTLIESRSLIVRFCRQKGHGVACEPVPKRRPTTINEIDNTIIDSNIESSRPSYATEYMLQLISTDQAVKASWPIAAEISHLDNSNSAFDSPSSIEEIDTKENVMHEVEKWKKRLQQKCVQLQNNTQNTTVQRRSSLEEMFAELDRGETTQTRANNSNRTAARSVGDVDIKQENDDDHSEEETPINNLLGLRYQEDAAEIKPEPDDEIESTHDSAAKNREEVSTDEFDYYEDFDTETDDEPAAIKDTQKTPNSSTTNPLEPLRQQEQTTVESKPDIATLAASVDVATVSEHSSFVKKLYNQVHRSKDVAATKCTDDLDDLFAQMNSDDNDEDDHFF